MIKYTRNSNLFENIDTEQKAYWIGFIAADGYVNQERKSIDIQLHSKDLEHLKKFQNFLQTDAPVKEIKDREAVRFQIYDEKLTKDLEYWGLVPRKSHTLEFPKKMSREIQKHFIRGLFDGDGSIYKHSQKTERGKGIYYSYRLEITGTKEVLQGVQSYFNGVGRIRFHKRAYRWEVNKKKEVETILKELYINNSIALERKNKLALEAIIINQKS